MNARCLPLLLFCVLASVSGFSQGGLQLKLQLMPDGNGWGVYVKPVGITPSDNLVTASGQVTVVMPNGYEWQNLESVSGQWINDASNFSPEETPDLQYISFGLNQAEPLYPIVYEEGVETLLFTFQTDEACPEKLYFLDCKNAADIHPFCPFFPDSSPGNNSVGNNPGLDLQIMDFDNGFELYTIGGTYAPEAWDCHDCDLDGIPNALEDTNGNGTYDPDEDASNLCLPDNPEHCLQMKIQYLEAEEAWGVYVRPQAGFSPSANAETLAGQVTIVAPEDFVFENLGSVAGEWSEAEVTVSPAENPGMVYTTFTFAEGQNPIGYAAGEETLLFTFDRMGDCPDSLYLWQPGNAFAAPPNLLTGFDPDNLQDSYYGLCGVYGKKKWRCPTEIIIIGGEEFPDSLGTGDNGNLLSGLHSDGVKEQDFQLGKVFEQKSWICKPAGFIIVGGDQFPDSLHSDDSSFKIAPFDFHWNIEKETNWLTLSPNPASSFLQIKINTKKADSQLVVKLWSLQGQVLQQHLAEGQTELQLDLAELPSGLYFISLEMDGKTLQRERFVKK